MDVKANKFGELSGFLGVLCNSSLESAGLDCDMEEANKVVSALSGKNVEEVIKEGKTKLSSVPSGGGAGAAAAAPAAAAAAPGTFCFTSNFNLYLAALVFC